jgi:hypothetical protein
MGTGACFPGAKTTVAWSSAEVKNVGAIPPLPIRLHEVLLSESMSKVNCHFYLYQNIRRNKRTYKSMSFSRYEKPKIITALLTIPPLLFFMKFLLSDIALIRWANKKWSHVFKSIQLFSMELVSWVQVKRWKDFTVNSTTPKYTYLSQTRNRMKNMVFWIVMAYSSEIPRFQSIRSVETPFPFWTIREYNAWDCTVHSHICKKLKSNIKWNTVHFDKQLPRPLPKKYNWRVRSLYIYRYFKMYFVLQEITLRLH